MAARKPRTAAGRVILKLWSLDPLASNSFVRLRQARPVTASPYSSGHGAAAACAQKQGASCLVAWVRGAGPAPQSFRQELPEEKGVENEVPAPEPARLREQPEQPFEPGVLHPGRGLSDPP